MSDKGMKALRRDARLLLDSIDSVATEEAKIREISDMLVVYMRRNTWMMTNMLLGMDKLDDSVRSAELQKVEHLRAELEKLKGK